MFKITFLLFIALVRGQTPLPAEPVTEEYDIRDADHPYDGGAGCNGLPWTDATAVAGEVGAGTHVDPFYAALNSESTADDTASSRCGEKFALFKTEDEDFEQDPIYIIIAASKNGAADELEIGPNACGEIEECDDSTYGVALKLPEIFLLGAGNTVDMCDDFNVEDSGEGENADSPYYVYVYASSTKKLFADHDHCGRLYQFGEDEKYVVVAGTTTGAGADGNGLELVIREEDCDNLATCDLEGYAIWTGETFTPPTTTPEETDSPSETSETSPETSTESTTESTTSSRLPLDTTTEEDSTFFAAVGLTLFALLA